jgi:HD superfamily phosphohydrolase
MLSQIRNSVFRDNIEGNRLIDVPKAVRKIIDTREFQRLRNIKQMGLSSFVFPTAEHSRFSHSVGVFATAMQAFRHLQRRAITLDIQTPGLRFDEHAQLEFGIAALCHDLGHSAYSHVLESILLPEGVRNHEDCTAKLLERDCDAAQAIRDCADLEAVTNLLKQKHANKALADLISSAFDVDRCDYVLRDSQMAGVEYGKYDLKWLLHAIAVDTNSFGQPILLLDGPRGLDALRQFLSARRYLHRQVYFHATIRGAQLLLKGIFARMQDIGAHEDTVRLAPSCLHNIARGRKLALEDFLGTTDIEVSFMIRSFANQHSDGVLRFLANLFVSRQFPKAVLDSAKSSAPLSKEYNIDEDVYESEQGLLLQSLAPKDLVSVTKDLTAFIASRLSAVSLPSEAAEYLVALDEAPFISTPPTDLLFLFQERVVPLEQIDNNAVGFDLKGLLETFTIKRVFVPREFVDDAREHVEREYHL